MCVWVVECGVAGFDLVEEGVYVCEGRATEEEEAGLDWVCVCVCVCFRCRCKEEEEEEEEEGEGGECAFSRKQHWLGGRPVCVCVCVCVCRWGE